MKPNVSQFDLIGRREWLFAMVIALVTIALTLVPYTLGYTFARPETEYTGLLVNIEDMSYYAVMLQGYQGAWQYHIQFTPEQHSPEFLYSFYLALGHLARILGTSIVTVWHAARILSTLLLLLLLFALIARFVPSRGPRRVAYLIAIFGSGFDWSLFPWEKLDILSGAPVDFHMPEAHLFYTMLTYPHVTIGVALTLVVFWLWLKAIESRQWRFALVAGIANLAIGIIYPFLIILIGAVLGAAWLYSMWRARRILGREFGFLLVEFIPVLPLYAYYEYVLLNNSVFRTWDAQATTLSPNPIHYLLAYGLMLVLAAPTVRLAFAEQAADGISRRWGLLWIWIIVAAILLYAPLNNQRRFVQGLQVPLSILATIGLFQVWLPRLERTSFYRALLNRPGYTVTGMRVLLSALMLSALACANLVILVKLSFMTGVDQPDALFRSRTEVQAVDWLGGHAEHTDISLAAYPTGAYIPARAGSAVFIGQRYETVHFYEKLADVDSFFNSSIDDSWRQAFLARFGIRYLFFGPRERDLGNFDPSRASYLESVYANSAVTIYRVQP